MSLIRTCQELVSSDVLAGGNLGKIRRRNAIVSGRFENEQDGSPARGRVGNRCDRGSRQLLGSKVV